jgi:two-component system cell cycle sensor histidine kinase/response regulator CckA
MADRERIDPRSRTSEFWWSLFDQSNDGLYVSSPDGVYLAVNPSGHRLLGYGDGELVGKRITDVVPAHDRSRVDEALEAVSGGAVRTEIWSMLCKDGSLKQLEVQAQSLSDGTVFAAARDLAGRPEFERRIQNSEAKLRSILHTAPDVIMSVDREGRILFINRTLPPLEVEQVVGTSCYDYVPAESRARVMQAIEHVFETRGLDGYEVEGPPDPEGVRRAVSVRVGPLIERDVVVAATLCATDLTERKQVEKARARLEEQLMQAQKMESVGQLAGGVAHDFNNLLTAMGSLVDLAMDEAPSANLREYLVGIRAAVERGSGLTQQLLAFARRKIVKPEDVELGSVLKRMERMVRSLVGEHVAVEIVSGSTPHVVRVDVGSLERVIMNLVVNARDAMPDGGRLVLETRSVVLDSRELDHHPELAAGRYAVLAVTDTGSGMSAEVRSRLFEPFFTTKPPGSGSGLGLAMCHGIVSQAGGKIAIESELGRGTTFEIFLPCAQPSERPATAAAAPVSRPASSGHETVLVVEDEPMILRVTRTALQRLGYHVYTAGDGVEALEVVASIAGPIDLVITDVVMPRLGGRELARRLAELRPETKILYTSGYAENAIAFGGVLSEGIHFMQKPYSLSVLAERVRKMLDGD